MKKSEIRIGGTYLAKVSGKLTTVRVDAIREYDPNFGGSFQRRPCQTHYDVTNLATGRKTTFRAATKFRGEATMRNLDHAIYQRMWGKPPISEVPS